MTATAATNPLVLLPPHPGTALLAAAYGLGHAGGTVICPTDETVPTLPTPPRRRNVIGGLNDFILRFDTRRNAIDDITVTHLEDAVEVAVTPRDNYIDPRDFLFAPSRAHFDGIVLLGADSPAAHPLWDASLSDALPEAPVTAYSRDTAAADIAADILTVRGDDLPAVAATCLLYAVMAESGGLRDGRTNAALLATVAGLMRRGGDLQQVTTALFKDTPLAFLRLWGATICDITVSDDRSTAAGILPPGTDTDAAQVDAALRYTAQFLPDTRRLATLWHDGTGTAGRILEGGAVSPLADRAAPQDTAHRLTNTDA